MPLNWLSTPKWKRTWWFCSFLICCNVILSFSSIFNMNPDFIHYSTQVSTDSWLSSNCSKDVLAPECLAGLGVKIYFFLHVFVIVLKTNCNIWYFIQTIKGFITDRFWNLVMFFKSWKYFGLFNLIKFLYKWLQIINHSLSLSIFLYLSVWILLLCCYELEMFFICGLGIHI